MFSKFQDRLNLAVKNSIPGIENARRSTSGDLTPTSPASINSYATAPDSQLKIDSELEEFDNNNDLMEENGQENKPSPTDSQKMSHPLEGPPTPPTSLKQSLDLDSSETTLPEIVKKKLEKLKKYESSYPELARAYKTQLAQLKSIDQVLQNMTPIQSCTDVEGLENHLKNLDAKNKMVMEELKRINKAQQDSQKESIELKKQLEEIQNSKSNNITEFDFVSLLTNINENLNSQSITLEDNIIVVLKDFCSVFSKKFGKRVLEIEDPETLKKAQKLDSVQKELDQMSVSKQELEDKLTKSSKELDDLKNQSTQSLEDNSHLKKKVQSLEIEVEELSKSSAKATDLEKQLEEIKESNKRKIEELEDQLDKSLKSQKALENKVNQVPPPSPSNNKKGKKNKGKSNNSNSSPSAPVIDVDQIRSQLEYSNNNVKHIYQTLDKFHSKVLDEKLPISITDPSVPIEVSELEKVSENLVKQWNDVQEQNSKSQKRGEIMNNLMGDLRKQLEIKNQEIENFKSSSDNSSKPETNSDNCLKCVELESKLENATNEQKELEDKLADNSKLLDDANTRKEQLQNMVEELETQVFALNETNNKEGNIKLQKLSKDFEIKKEEVEDLKKNLQETQTKFNKAQSEIEKLSKSGKDLIDQNSGLTKQVDALSQSKKDLENQIKSLNEKISSLNNDHKVAIQKLDDSLNGSKSALKLCQKQVKQLESENKDLQTELSKLNTKCKEIETKLTSVQKEYGELQTKNSSHNDEIKQLQEQNDSYSSQNKDLISQLDESKLSNEDLLQNQTKMEQKVEQLQKELNQTKSQLEEIKIVSEEREDLVLATKKELSNFKSKAQLLEQELCTSRDLFESKSLELDQIRNELSTCRQQFQSVQSSSEDQNQKSIQQISQLEDEIEAIRQQAKERIESLESNLAETKTEYESVKISLDDKSSELSTLQANYEQIKSQFTEIETKFKSAELELSQLDSNAKKCIELKETLEMERVEKNSQIEQAQMRESHLRNLNRDLKDEIRRLQRVGGNHANSMGSSPSQTPSPKNSQRISESGSTQMDDGTPINLEYLRHVILKFFEDRDRRPQLTTILSHLLKFSPNEAERLSQIVS